MKPSAEKTILIVGGGHASLPVIKMGEKWKKENIQVMLISAKPYLIYSGALPQFMAGFYDRNQTSVDLSQLCERYKVPFTVDEVVAVNKNERTVSTSGGKIFSYDYLLINVGSSTKPIVEGEQVFPVKPMSRLLDLREKIVSGQVRSLLILGGGAAGCELALNLSHPWFGNRPEITIIDKNERLLSSFPEKLSSQVASILEDRGVSIVTGMEGSFESMRAHDKTILATGNKPGSVSIEHQFEAGTEGRILTEDSLQVKNNPNVFAAGDMADVGGKSYPQIGVHAVKQGVLLRKNLKSAILGRSLADYKPYFTNPLILSNGPNSAFYIMNRWVLKGRLYAVLKYVLDMRWLDKYRETPAQRRSDLKLIKEAVNRSGSGN